MPSIYLSPSLQEWNPYVDGGNEEYYMNLIADAMEPYLRASGIDFKRNSPEMTLRQAISDSNSGNYDLHLAIHSNASGENNAGKNRGVEVYYYPTSTKGQDFAETLATNFSELYPEPSKVKTIPTTSLGELRLTRAPASLIEVAYHDNIDDARWIRDNINAIAKNLAKSVAETLNVPFVEP
ncbi:MAG: N-acetylmuramoyl-L-alanine amidase [Ruminococcus sp.]|jgi:N-acetylmuramoyl-L-alanine amidase|nr:N-acetylmuramoyl-L-alanine amidase [Ruminococcus sp.]